MTLPRFRNRHQAAPPLSRRARAARQAESGWPAPWMPWAVGTALVLAGALFSYIPLSMVARPEVGQSAVRTGCPRPTPGTTDAAAMLGPGPTLTAAAGDQVELAWVVKNAGQTTWCVDRYRFDPAEGQSSSVISLPRELTQAEVTTVHARVTVPATIGPWNPAWDLSGPDGRVEGGRLTAQIYVTAGP